jgi:hypothetical protein
MLTISKVLSDARALGIKLAPRSFWNYCEQGLLPKGRKLPGHGNCTYFPADTLLQLYVVLLLKDLRVPHSILVGPPGSGQSRLIEALLIHLKDRRPESLPSISQSKRRVAEEYKNVLLETVKRAISIRAEPPCAAPMVDKVLPPSTVKTVAEVKGRKFRDAPEVTPENPDGAHDKD